MREKKKTKKDLPAFIMMEPFGTNSKYKTDILHDSWIYIKSQRLFRNHYSKKVNLNNLKKNHFPAILFGIGNSSSPLPRPCRSHFLPDKSGTSMRSKPRQSGVIPDLFLTNGQGDLRKFDSKSNRFQMSFCFSISSINQSKIYLKPCVSWNIKLSKKMFGGKST